MCSVIEKEGEPGIPGECDDVAVDEDVGGAGGCELSVGRGVNHFWVSDGNSC